MTVLSGELATVRTVWASVTLVSAGMVPAAPSQASTQTIARSEVIQKEQNVAGIRKGWKGEDDEAERANRH